MRDTAPELSGRPPKEVTRVVWHCVGESQPLSPHAGDSRGDGMHPFGFALGLKAFCRHGGHFVCKMAPCSAASGQEGPLGVALGMPPFSSKLS